MNRFITDDGILILRLSGKLISSTLDGLKGSIDSIIEEKRDKVVVNFKLINIIDSVAIGLIVSRFKSLKNQKEVILTFCDLQPAIKSLLMLSDIEKWIDIYPTEDSAIKAIRKAVG